MAEGIKETGTNILLALAVVFCLISFTYIFQVSNDVPQNNSITNSPIFSNLNESIGDLITTTTTTTANELNASSITSSQISFGWVIWNGIIGFGKTVISLPIGIFNGLRSSLGLAFGTVIFVIFDIAGIAIVIYLIVLLYRFFRQGS